MVLGSMLNSAEGKGGQPPAAKSAVEAMPRVEIKEGEEVGECVICLEEYKVGTTVKKMPCQHGFHEECIEKWLGLHGSCPVCRYVMPVEEGDDVDKKGGDDVEEREGVGERERERERTS
ncbi:E3 ubiquitin-protein ligase MPSR1-like [Silene latifolia]|uniref:E3 ubiquitin-protein ligase MPSR1-like n=1 Tax=Silene latifolia TaxID=37657 RepID=UPI003D7735C4